MDVGDEHTLMNKLLQNVVYVGLFKRPKASMPATSVIEPMLAPEGMLPITKAFPVL
jgi:hypothetical protein